MYAYDLLLRIIKSYFYNFQTSYSSACFHRKVLLNLRIKITSKTIYSNRDLINR